MTESLRITIDDLRQRMEKGEDFVVIDTRNQQEWAKSDVKVPKAIRVSADSIDEVLFHIPKEKPIVTYCT
jgi:rhodanese-related sulfurtransferase